MLLMLCSLTTLQGVIVAHCRATWQCLRDTHFDSHKPSRTMLARVLERVDMVFNDVLVNLVCITSCLRHVCVECYGLSSCRRTSH